MTIKIEQDGKEIEVFTPEEVAAKDAEIERLSKISAEKTENFKKYNEMTQEEREAHSENELNLIRRNDDLETKVNTLTETIAQKEAREKQEAKDKSLKAFHNDLPEVKTKLEEKYALLAGMPEDTTDQIRARTMEAARLAGISIDSRNPIYQHFDGEAPKLQDHKEFVETEKGKEAASLVAEALKNTQ